MVELLHQRLEAQATRTPTAVAVHFEDAAITYADFVARSRAAATFLARCGVQAGEVVGWLGSNQPFMLELLHACSRLGLLLVPLNTRLTAAEHRAQLEHAEAALLIVDQALPTDDALGASRLEVADRSGLPASLDWPDVGGDEPTEATELLLVYTSGTTGSPKGVVHTQRSVAFTLANGIETQQITADDITLSFLPLFHVGGLNIQTLPTLVQGGTVVLHRSFDPTHVLADAERFGATTSLMVPATIGALLDHPTWTSADLSTLRRVQTGSSVVPTSMLIALNDRGLAAGQVYGSTETGPTSVVLSSDESQHVGAAGRAAPHTETRIVDGELQVRGPNLFSHYRSDPDATAAAFDDGWFRTGDLAHVDELGLIYIEGRADDVIISGGENIDPVEVEQALADAPGVAEVAVVAGPDDRWGQVPVAVVVADADETPTLEGLRAHAELRLARYKLPTRLVVVDELPRTALGKVKKYALRAELNL